MLDLGCWKLYKTIFQSVLEAKKLEKLKCASNLMKSHYSPFQIWCPHYSFVNDISNSNPRMKILLFLNSTKAGLLKNVQKHLSGYFGSREMSKTKVGTFFETPCMLCHLTLWMWKELKWKKSAIRSPRKWYQIKGYFLLPLL